MTTRRFQVRVFSQHNPPTVFELDLSPEEAVGVAKVAAELNLRVSGPENPSMRLAPVHEVRTQPTQTCQTCGNTEVVRQDGRGFPPDIARRRLEKRCRAAGHACVPRYTAGLVLAPRTSEGDPQ